MLDDRLALRIDDTGGLGVVRVDEHIARIGLVIREFAVTVAQGLLQRLIGRDVLGAALQLCLAFIVGSTHGLFDLCQRCLIRLGDAELDAVLRRSAVDCLRLPGVDVGPQGIGAGNNLHRIGEFCHS